ncbi:MAG: hypothetical protein M3305_15465 [Actinomycetota bacterium]|nr:hypothetical protein [Actinomycetota bacterium]
MRSTTTALTKCLAQGCRRCWRDSAEIDVTFITVRAAANAVATVVESLALSRPEAGFFLRSDGRRSLALPAAADLRERISQVHGLSLARSLIALEDPVVWGFVSPLAVSFPTRRYLHVAVNGRVVEADSFAPAVAKAYADLLPKGRHPAAFLRLELGPGEVDVNVHPAKSAVRLRGGRSAYPLVVGTIRAALAGEREVGGAPPEETSHELTPIGQFAGRCINKAPHRGRAAPAGLRPSCRARDRRGGEAKAGDVALPEDIPDRVKEWAGGEEERDKQREAFLGRLRAVGKDPMATLESMGG